MLLMLALVVVCAAIVAIGRLQADATAARDAQLELTALRLDVAQIQDVPWGASPDEGDDPQDVRDELEGAQLAIQRSLATLRTRDGLPNAETIERPFDRSALALWEIFRLVSDGRQDRTGPASNRAARQAAQADGALQDAAKVYRARASAALTKSRFGSAGVILVLFAAFAWFYVRAARARRRAETLAGENCKLLAVSRQEALTDALTGLGNRRALKAVLHAAAPQAGSGELMLAVFDLDGFKQYNDSFGHPAGDALLARLGARLASTMDGLGTAFRMGGDEFCITASAGLGSEDGIAALAASALSESGEGFAIGCSFGVARMPTDSLDPDVALLLADQRMYEQKSAGRVPPSRQTRDVLLRLLAERSSELGQHTSDVSALAADTARQLGLHPEQVEAIRLAAELHDIGKAAIPDAILNKPGALTDDEWAFIHRHTVIGERIVRAAPSLAHTADLVRSHHERHDGSGYPDALSGDAIPIGARIITVSDSFDAMTTDRPYRAGMSAEDGLNELRRCAGTQFDPAVVDAFIAAHAHRAPTAARS
jgi:two-component system cell cycle response regulator